MAARASGRFRAALDAVRSLSLADILLLLMVIALSVQGFTLFRYGRMGFSFSHVCVLAAAAVMVGVCARSRLRPVAPPFAVNALLAVFALTTLIAIPRYGFGAMLLKYLFQYLVIVVMLNFFRLFSFERATRLIAAASWIVLAIVVANALLHIDAFIEYYANPWEGHPDYDTVFSGGVNMEASWIAMLGVFGGNDRRGRAYLAASLLLSIVLTSRAGLMLSALAAVYVLVVKSGLFARHRAWAVRGLLLLAVAALAVVALGVALGIPMFDRLTQIGFDGSSSSRLRIWRTAFAAFLNSPITGVGAGNAMKVVVWMTGHWFSENNVHNYPLQVLTDFGVAGFAVFLVAVVAFVRQNARVGFRNPFAAFVALYLIAGFIQFAGAELFVGFSLAGLFAFGPGCADPAERAPGSAAGIAAGQPATSDGGGDD